jgi:hypothetical protein
MRATCALTPAGGRERQNLRRFVVIGAGPAREGSGSVGIWITAHAIPPRAPTDMSDRLAEARLFIVDEH